MLYCSVDFSYRNNGGNFTIVTSIRTYLISLTDNTVSSSRARRPPRARDGSALHSLTALPSPWAVIKLTRVYKSVSLCATGFVLLMVVSRLWLSAPSVCVWGMCHLITLLIKSKQATVFRRADTASRLESSGFKPYAHNCWFTSSCFRRCEWAEELERPFWSSSTGHVWIIISRNLSLPLFADIRAAHSSLVLIKSNRSKPEAITTAARWADLRGDPPGA